MAESKRVLSLDAAIHQSSQFGKEDDHLQSAFEDDMSESNTFSLEMDAFHSSVDRSYPSVRDYYRANIKDKTSGKPIQLQKGLSNYSDLKLGDDRLSASESVLSATYRMPVEHMMTIDSPSINMQKVVRKREYQNALKKVGEVELNRLERVMKDKLFQRSYATSSPFQVRKAFKFFDREQSMKISIEGFTKAMEFLGFQFAEMQNLALFARYDNNCCGEIDYMYFIATAMFYPAIEPDFGMCPPTPATVISDVKDAHDIDTEIVKQMQRDALKEVFNKIDKQKRGYIEEKGFELITIALGYKLNITEISSCLADMGTDNGKIPFDLFFEWWTDPMGVMAIRRKMAVASN